MTVRRAKPQISLGVRPVWSESLLCAKWVATCKDPRFLHAASEDTDQTGRMQFCWFYHAVAHLMFFNSGRVKHVSEGVLTCAVLA